MFEKKCKQCSRKVGRDFDFCPYCGFNIKKDSQEKDFGFLGVDDQLDLNSLNLGMPLNAGGGFGKLFDSLVKQLDNQMRVLDKEMGQVPKKIPIKSNALSISISTGTGKKPEIKIQGFGPRFQSLEQIEQKEIKPNSQISEEKAKKLAKMPREEAETSVRRLSNKVIYEIELPGIKNTKDLLINKLENSIEIKAFSQNKVYFKLIPVNLPIIDYELKNEKLILELKAK